MSEEKSDKVLVFLMVGGAMLASEGAFDNFLSKVTGDLFEATRPDDGTGYYINLRNCLSINLVSRDAVVAGPQVIQKVSGRLQ